MQRRWPWPGLMALGLLLGALMAAPNPAGGAEPKLAPSTGFAASHSAFLASESTALGVPPGTDLFVGATQGEVSSQPRAQAYGATVGSPAFPTQYRGQCRANYPGEPREDTCGLPAETSTSLYRSGRAGHPGNAGFSFALVAGDDWGATRPPPGTARPGLPSSPSSSPSGSGSHSKKGVPALPSPTAAGEGGRIQARVSTVRVQASGTDQSERVQARSSVEAVAVAVGGFLRIGTSTSESRSVVEDGVISAATISRATDLSLGGIFHIGTLEAEAQAVAPGDAGEGVASAQTEVLDATVAGVPVTLGAEGLLVQGQPLAEAPEAIARPILDALAARRMTIEPLPPPTVTRDAVSGLAEASSAGFRVVVSAFSGEQFEVILGQARVRVTATPVLPAPLRVPAPRGAGPAVPVPVVPPPSAPVVPALPTPGPAVNPPTRSLRVTAPAEETTVAPVGRTLPDTVVAPIRPFDRQLPAVVVLLLTPLLLGALGLALPQGRR